MNNMLSPRLLFILLVILVSGGVVLAQDNPPPEMNRQQPNAGPQGKRPNLLRLLGLTPDQAQQLRQINQERKPQMDAAMQRLRQANRALDEAIYADNVDDAAFQARLKEVNLAQAEVAKLRFTNELAVRRILTPEQLGRFREMRRRFAPPRQDGDGPRGVDDKNPVPRSQRRPPQ
jgi:Spy/CpxP family protein refolding chaperone